MANILAHGLVKILRPEDFYFCLLSLLFFIDRMLPSDRVVFLEFEFSLDRLSVLGRIIGVAFAHPFFVPDGDELYEFIL